MGLKLTITFEEFKQILDKEIPMLKEYSLISISAKKKRGFVTFILEKWPHKEVRLQIAEEFEKMSENQIKELLEEYGIN